MSDFPLASRRSMNHVAALCDLSPAAMNAAWRAAIIARDLAVPLKLLYQRPQPAWHALPGSLAALQARVTEQLGPPMTLEAVDRDALRDIVGVTRDGLLVVPSSRGNPIRERFMGTQAERLIRLSRGPVLVVKQPAGAAYRRVFVAADLRERSSVLLAAGASLSRHARVTVFHAFAAAGEMHLREPDASPTAIRQNRAKQARRAATAIKTLVMAQRASHQSAASSPADVKTVVVCGPPAPMIQSAAYAARSELLVIGKCRRGLLADFFLGSVTQSVLASSQSDVLVVPLSEWPDMHSNRQMTLGMKPS